MRASGTGLLTVTVRYHPKHPERSILGEEIAPPRNNITELKLD